MRDIILRFVTMPMAVTIFKQDKEKFDTSKVNILYYDLIDSILDKLQNDFNELKADMYRIHHLDVKHLGKNNGVVRYRVNSDVIEFSPEELKKNTESLMRDYLSNAELKRSDHVWGK